MEENDDSKYKPFLGRNKILFHRIWFLIRKVKNLNGCVVSVTAAEQASVADNAMKNLNQ